MKNNFFKKLPDSLCCYLKTGFVVVLSLLFVYTVLGCVLAKAEVSGNNWMSKVPGSTLLCDINIPGTHDSGTTYTTGVVTGVVASCQDDTIPEQLEKGIRYLDIRCDSDLDINHGGVVCYTSPWTIKKNKLTFNKVLDNIEDFLDENPSETVILQLKKEGKGKGNFLEGINNSLKSRKRIFKPSSSSISGVNMDDLRGKFVIFSKVDGVEPAYRFAGWSNNCAYCNSEFAKAICLVQDNYKLKTEREKLYVVKSFYDKVWKENLDNTFVVNFTSCVGPFCPELVAKRINPKFEKYVDENKGKKFGIVLMDIPSEKLISKIYNSNFA